MNLSLMNKKGLLKAFFCLFAIVLGTQIVFKVLAEHNLIKHYLSVIYQSGLKEVRIMQKALTLMYMAFKKGIQLKTEMCTFFERMTILSLLLIIFRLYTTFIDRVIIIYLFLILIFCL